MQKAIFSFAFVMLAGSAAAQTSPEMTGDLTVTLSPHIYRICNDRPVRPAWMEGINPREAYKAVTLMELYEIRAWEVIAETKDCGCNIRFPSWDRADAEYHDAHAGRTQAEHSALRRDWIAVRKKLEPKVREICEAQGNW